MNNESFYENLDFRYPEIGEVLVGGNPAKIYIPTLMPLIENAGSESKSKSIKAGSKTNVLNKGSLTLSSIIKKNYISLSIPEYIGKVKKGDKVIISFIGGDPNQAKVIGKVD